MTHTLLVCDAFGSCPSKDVVDKLLANQLISDKANYFTSKDYQRFRSGYCEIPKVITNILNNVEITVINSTDN